jgi:hypothetical protein
MAAKGGLPEATAKMQELRDVLRDPALISAVDAITSKLIIGFSGAATAIGQTVAGLRELGVQGGVFAPRNGQEMIDAATAEIGRIDEQLRRGAQPFSRVPRVGDDLFDVDSAVRESDLEALRRRRQALQREIELIQNFSAPNFQVGEISIPEIYTTEDADRADEKRKDELRNFMDGMEMRGQLTEDMGKLTADAIETIDDEIIKSSKETADSIVNDVEYTTDEFKKNYKEMSVFADEAARNMQDAFADFLFAPFENGIKGMLRGFVDVIRRMIAEAAAAKLAEKIFGEGGAGSKFLESVLGAAGSTYGGTKAVGGPLEQGKWYIAGERGPEPIWGGGQGAFAMGYGGGGMPPIVVNNQIDARGATMELANALPEILRRNNEQLKNDIVTGFQRRRWSLPRG